MTYGQRIIEKFKEKADAKSMQNLINLFESGTSVKDISELAKVLAGSGVIIERPNPGSKKIVDIPSTGGPSSLSTLLTPLYLSEFGMEVIKIGVPGRPAGGIDVLSQIEGYRINANATELNKWRKSGYVHLMAGKDFAPLDHKLFQYRKENNKIGVRNVVIASLLSKKVAAGINLMGLDVRVSERANFGSTISLAHENAVLFKEVAKILGINSVCFLTNCSLPYQPYLGRGESLLALKYILFDRQPNEWLSEHNRQCLEMSKSLALIGGSYHLDFNIKEAFENNLKCQGGSLYRYLEYSEKVARNHNYKLLAWEEGYLQLDLYQLRDAIVKYQTQDSGKGFSDPCGVIFEIRPGNIVRRGESICSMRCTPEIEESFISDVKSCFQIKRKPVKSYYHEIIV